MDWDIIHPVLDLTFWDNTVQAWLIAFALFCVAYIGLGFFKNLIANRLASLAKRTVNNVDDFATELIADIRGFLIAAIALYIGSLALTLPKGPTHVIQALPILALLLQSVFWGNRLISFGLDKYLNSIQDEQRRLGTQTMLGPMKFVARLLLISILVLLALDNMGMDITTLVAGLGVGGVAIALAVQSILGDLFAAISIIIDKPFVVGDFIVVGDFMGHVEHIGLKTTRVRSLGGEQLIFSNSDMLSSRIRNYKRMNERRIMFRFGVTYQTPLKQLEEIPGIVKQIIDAIELARFSRTHFFSYGDSSLDFEVVYFVLSSEYDDYMDTQQAINLALFKQFTDAGIEFAYPTRTLFVTHEGESHKEPHLV
ncbi:MAG: mechanosensitive ion channel family protein [Vampirovibrio sp.]|nr:mechanosensitive ion channel family protein [Vampirovibrio sp.]